MTNRNKKRVKRQIRQLMKQKGISIEELSGPEPRQERRQPRTPKQSGFPRKESEENIGFKNPIGKKIRGFQNWLRRMGNTPSVTKGSSRPVETVFEDIFGRR